MGERRGMKALELWCRRVTQGYPGVKVENMTTSWRDGLAFCAIIHHFRPDLIDFSRLDKSDIYGNNELAFRTAERHLGIPSLLDAEDMLEYPVPDRLSILTYLSLFYQAFASNGSSPVKRSPEATDGSLLLVSPNVQASPTKGSVGRGREPCVVCDLPVFIAQRLRVSGKLYHRTCFRCARCDTQLSPADCYETLNSQFCCETCPDEMKEEESNGTPPEPPVEPLKETKVKPEPPEPPPTLPPKPSLVGLRKMMFESYAKDTDDAKLNVVDHGALQGSYVNTCLDSSVKDLHLKNDSSSDNRLIEEDHIVDCVNKDVIYNLDETESQFSIGDTPESLPQVNLEDVSPSTEEIVANAPLDKGIFDVEKESAVECVNNVLLDSVVSEEKSISITNSDKDNKTNDDNSIMEAVNTIVTCTDNIIETECDNSKIALVSPESVTTEICAPLTEDSPDLAPPIVGPEKDTSQDNPDTQEDTRKDEESYSNSTKSNTKPSPLLYPEDLNPFADEDDGKVSTNPFGSDSEEEVTIEKVQECIDKIKPSQSLNPFGSEGEEEEEEMKRRPVPLPRRTVTPEPSPMPRTRLRSSGRSVGSVSSLARRKKPAPPPPSPAPTVSYPTTPRIRKARRAPLPPGQSTPNSSLSTPSDQNYLPVLEVSEILRVYELEETKKSEDTSNKLAEISIDVEDKKDEVKHSDSSHQHCENQEQERVVEADEHTICNEEQNRSPSISSRRRLIIPLVLKGSEDDIPGLLNPSKDESYRSLTSTSSMSIPDDISCQEDLSSPPSEKKHKDSTNLQMKTTEGSYLRNKSTYGLWKRKKGPAPSIPFPEKRPLKPMPILKLKQELEDIEVKQQGLERQGVSLEKKIREKFSSEASVTPYVEELVLQLFELVNEKNELFRRQAELMYLRRQYHLEEEHAELEYQIRCLMARPEANKTDSDKELEELLIQRLVEVVERRDAIVQCLERDRLREAEEDKSVNAQLNKFSEAMGGDTLLSKISKKQKKIKKERQKEFYNTYKTVDLDKDLDESEKEHKKKKKWFTISPTKGKH